MNITKNAVLPSALRCAARGVMAVLGIAVMVAAAPVRATEGGATNKALGVDTILAGVIGPHGSVRITNFLADYQARNTLDGSGNPRPGLSNFRLKATAFTSRLQYVWPETKVLGADVESRVGLTWYADANVSFDVQTPGGLRAREGSSSGWFPAALVGPVILGWHGETVHQMAGIEFYFPTIAYNVGQPVNVGSGFSSVAPHYWVTWYPRPDIEVDGSFVYLINQKNRDSQYKSGREFSMDYGIGYTPTRGWQVGASGYAYKQISDDSLNGVTVPGGNRGRVLATGPFLRYQAEAPWGITFKWQREFSVENRAKGNRYFLQFAYRPK
jgi:hypothetical protein